MSGAKIPPDADIEFDQFADKFIPYADAHKVVLGLSDAQLQEVDDGGENWTASYADHLAKQTAATAATAAKDAAKAALMTALRTAIRIIQNNPSVTDEMRVDMGLPVHDDTRTRVPVPTTKPVLQVSGREHLQHVIAWRDEAKPKSKAKPAGVRGAQVWLWIGPNPPADPAGFRWVALDGATPYLMVHEGADAGKLAYYALRWENTRGEAGPWSDVVSATIPA